MTDDAKDDKVGAPPQQRSHFSRKNGRIYTAQDIQPENTTVPNPIEALESSDGVPQRPPTRPSTARPSSSHSRPHALKPAIETQESPSSQKIEIQSPPSPTSVAEIHVEKPDIQLFETVLYSQIVKKLLKLRGLQKLEDETYAEISQITQAITAAIAEFKALLEQNPTVYCRTANNMTLWTEKRHQAIKDLQKKIKPHFDRVNQILSEPQFVSTSSKQLYSSPIGRKQASIHGPILETSPFGKILESTSIHTMLKRCFGPNAFSGNSSKELYKEMSGGIIERKKNSPEHLANRHAISFKTDVDTAVIIGVWEAISSSYAEEETDEAHIYVPFGIGANSVVWNHELPELRKKYTDDHIIIHTLSHPEEYQALKHEYDKVNSELWVAMANPDMPSEIVFSLRMDRDEAQNNMDNYLNEAKNWEQAPIHQSNVNLVTRNKGTIPLHNIKHKVQELRNKKKQQSDAHVSQKNQVEGDSEEDSSDSVRLD